MPGFQDEHQVEVCPQTIEEVRQMSRKIKCRPLRMPEVFHWGDTTPNWGNSVDEYMAIRTFNRLCDLVNHRDQKNHPGK